jgi:integrase
MMRHIADGGNMSVRKRKWLTRKGEPKEAWIVDYTDQDGDRHIETFDRKKDADAYAATVKVDVRQGVHTAPTKSVTVAEAGQNWIKRVEANGMRGKGPVEEGTLYQYRQHLNLYIAPRLGGIKLANLTKTGVENFRDYLLGSMSRALARKVLTSFKSILKAANYAHVAADVSIGISKRHKRPIETGVDFPTPAEVKRIVEAATDTKRRALLRTAILTGLRASELRGLRWKDVDLKARELHVRQRADRFCKLGSPKSAMSRRTVPLAPEVVTDLKEWRIALGPKGELDLVFPNASGRVEQHKSMLESTAPVLVAAGVLAKDKDGKPRPKYALHAYRHFFASWCINPVSRGGRGLSAKEVQALLGHETIGITMDIYGHLFPRGDDHAELAASTARLFG